MSADNEKSSVDYSSGYSIVLYDYDTEQMFMAYFKDMDSLMANCECNDRDPSECFVFKGKLEVVAMPKSESSEEESDEDCDCSGCDLTRFVCL